MIYGWFLALCAPQAPLIRCDIIKEFRTPAQCRAALDRIGRDRGRCVRIAIDTE